MMSASLGCTFKWNPQDKGHEAKPGAYGEDGQTAYHLDNHQVPPDHLHQPDERRDQVQWNHQPVHKN